VNRVNQVSSKLTGISAAPFVLTARQPWPFTLLELISSRRPVEIVLIVAAAGGLLGCFASVARLDVSKPKHQVRHPGQRIAAR
jgi:hypothetical protein